MVTDALSTDVSDTTMLRQVLGCFATGVAVVASQGQTGPAGVLVNSFTSVSLAPPIVLFCIDRDSRTWPSVERSGCFAVSFLAGEQASIAYRFQQSGIDRFEGVETLSPPTGSPVIAGALGYVDCEVIDVLTYGDHHLVFGAVREAARLGSEEPMIFFRGRLDSISL